MPTRVHFQQFVDAVTPPQPVPLHAEQPGRAWAWCHQEPAWRRARIALAPKACAMPRTLQTMRTKRCAITACSEVDTMKGGTPMSSNRNGVLMASRVCRVDSNQVARDGSAHTDFSGFGIAHFTPTSTTSGLWRSTARSTCEGKGRFFVDLHLRQTGQAVFDGVFHRNDLCSSAFR